MLIYIIEPTELSAIEAPEGVQHPTNDEDGRQASEELKKLKTVEY